MSDFEEKKILLLSAMEDIRKPISPRAVIAQPMIEAGYSDSGFAPAGAVCWAELAGVSPLTDGVSDSAAGGIGVLDG